MLRKARNPNDADDANDAKSGIWYRDILKTASQASSASLSSRKNSEGVWGTPQKCVCGYPNAMLAILLLAKYVSPQIDIFGYVQETFLYGYSYLSYNEKGRTDVAMLELITLVRANCQPPSHCSIRLVQVEILVKATDQTFE